MKYLKGMLNKKSKIFASIVQIILTVLILPILCFILSLLSGTDDAFDVITNLLDELAVTEYWANILIELLRTSEQISALDVYDYCVRYIHMAVFETCVIGMCVALCKNIGIILRIRGIPLIQSILGIFLGCIMARYFGIANELTTLFYCAMLIVLNVIVIWLLPTGAFYRKFLAIFLGLGLQIIVAVLMAGYVIYLSLVREGQITDLRIAVPYIASIFVPLLIVVSIDYLLLTPEEDRLGL